MGNRVTSEKSEPEKEVQIGLEKAQAEEQVSSSGTTSGEEVDGESLSKEGAFWALLGDDENALTAYIDQRFSDNSQKLDFSKIAAYDLARASFRVQKLIREHFDGTSVTQENSGATVTNEDS